jgi:hypothetical protein
MTFWHIMTELFFVGIIVLGTVVFIDTIKQALKGDDND